MVCLWSWKTLVSPKGSQSFTVVCTPSKRHHGRKGQENTECLHLQKIKLPFFILPFSHEQAIDSTSHFPLAPKALVNATVHDHTPQKHETLPVREPCKHIFLVRCTQFLEGTGLCSHLKSTRVPAMQAACLSYPYVLGQVCVPLSLPPLFHP